MEIEACASVERDLDRFISKLESLREDSCTDIEDIAALMNEMFDILIQAEKEMVATMNTSTQADADADADADTAADAAANSDEPMEEVEANVQVEVEPSVRKLKVSQLEIMHDCITKAIEKMQVISADHRELHGSVSKVGKAIDRNLVSDFSSTMRVDALQDEENMMLLNKVIAKHYCRQGMDEVARLLIKESKMPEEMANDVFDSERSFAEIYRIWRQIQQRELTPALEWAEKHADKLVAKNSVLEFKLHRLAFLQIIARGVDSQSEAIAYARKNFIKFADRFEHEIPNLMGCFIYLPMGVLHSPYRHLFTPDIFTEVSYIFMKDACNALGISKNSALSVVINAGCTALPALLNIKQVMQSRQVLGMWNGCDELPIEIDLDPEYRFHSIFACPILRQQTSEDNPPKKLTCGHVISNDALHKLSNGHILKCPYCPVEQNAEEAVRIYF